MNFGTFWGSWLVMFLAIKIFGCTLAAWSWWWVLLPVIPDFALIFHKLGLM